MWGKPEFKVRAQEPTESGGGRAGLPVPDSPYGLCGRKVTSKSNRVFGRKSGNNKNAEEKEKKKKGPDRQVGRSPLRRADCEIGQEKATIAPLNCSRPIY